MKKGATSGDQIFKMIWPGFDLNLREGMTVCLKDDVRRSKYLLLEKGNYHLIGEYYRLRNHV